VYSQRIRESYKGVPIVVGGIEASLRRIAHFDYWSEQVRRSVLLDAKADLLVYGNAERQIGEIARRLDEGALMADITDLRAPRTCAAACRRAGWKSTRANWIHRAFEPARRSLRQRGRTQDRVGARGEYGGLGQRSARGV